MRMGMQAVYQLALCATIITVLSACGFLHVRAATAATYYVATNGSDSNPGTQSAPFGTISKGLATIHAGDTLYLRGGTYNEAINSNNQTIPTGTSWSNPVTIASSPGESATLKPSSGGAVLDFNAYNTSYNIQYIIFDRLILDGSNTIGVVSILGNPNGFQSHHIRFQNGEVRYSSG